MKWGPRRSGWTQPTGTGGKKRNFARYTSTEHSESPICLVANRAAGTSCAAYPLNTLDTANDEFAFVLDSDGMIPAIRTANAELLVHPQLSLLRREPQEMLGWGTYRTFTETGRSEAPQRVVEPGGGLYWSPAGVSFLAHAARHGVFEFASAPGRGTAVRAMLPIPAQLAAAGPVGPGVAAGECLFQMNNRMGNQRSDLTWPSI
jgi:hypothetical protein